MHFVLGFVPSSSIMVKRQVLLLVLPGSFKLSICTRTLPRLLHSIPSLFTICHLKMFPILTFNLSAGPHTAEVRWLAACSIWSCLCSRKCHHSVARMPINLWWIRNEFISIIAWVSDDFILSSHSPIIHSSGAPSCFQPPLSCSFALPIQPRSSVIALSKCYTDVAGIYF